MAFEVLRPEKDDHQRRLHVRSRTCTLKKKKLRIYSNITEKSKISMNYT